MACEGERRALHAGVQHARDPCHTRLPRGRGAPGRPILCCHRHLRCAVRHSKAVPVRTEGPGRLCQRSAGLPGLEPQSQESSIQARTASLTASVLQRSDVVLLVLDARAGVLPSDHGVVAWLRAHNPERMLLVANKAEGRGRNEAPGAPAACVALRPQHAPGQS